MAPADNARQEREAVPAKARNGTVSPDPRNVRTLRGSGETTR